MNGCWHVGGYNEDPRQAVPIEILKFRMDIGRPGVFDVDARILRDTKFNGTDRYPEGWQVGLPAKEVFIHNRSAHYWSRRYCREVHGLTMPDRDTFDDNCTAWVVDNY